MRIFTPQAEQTINEALRLKMFVCLKPSQSIDLEQYIALFFILPVYLRVLVSTPSQTC